MSSEDQWNRAAAIGEKNHQTLELVKNWCAHARLDRTGGIGMVEQTTGYPIGHLAVICDYAPAGGIYTWDLAGAALDFHDRHCVGCVHREPVGFPNLSKLLAERDAARQKASAQERARQEAYQEARAARQAVRDRLRVSLDAISATVVDQLSALDSQAEEHTAASLVEAAKLAPEAFPPALVDYLFVLVETGQGWAAETALQILLELKADQVRLVRCAMLALKERTARDGAVAVMMATLDHVEPSSVSGALPALIELADPIYLPIMHADRPGAPEGLLALHRRFPGEVERAIDDLLVRTDFDSVSIGARGTLAVAKGDSAAAARMARSAVSTLVRSKALNDQYDGSGQAIHALRQAVAEAYRANPTRVDTLIDDFTVGATNEGKARAFSVYREVLGSRWEEMVGEPTPAQHAAMRRLIRATTEDHPEEVQREVQSIFQSSARELRPLAARHIDALLGAALLLDDRVRHLEEETKQPAANFLETLERETRRSGAAQLQMNLVGWAAEAAAGNLTATREYLALLQNLPEDREWLRTVMVRHFKKLTVSPETFSLMLPQLYGALVGASVLLRGAAAKVVGELSPRFLDDAPPLLLEAFVALLSDHYLYPIKSAVSAMDRMRLPEPYRPVVQQRLFQIIRAYADNQSESEFLIDCVDLFVRDHLTEAQRAGRPGTWALDILLRHPPREYAKSLWNLTQLLSATPGIGRLVTAALRDDGAMIRSDDVIRALRQLSPEAIAEVRADLLEVGRGADLFRSEEPLAGAMIEVFTAAADWKAAEEVATSAVAKVGNTRRERVLLVVAKLVQASVTLERAVAEGRTGDLDRLSASWRSISEELEAGILTASFSARLDGIAALRNSANPKTSDPAALRSAATALDEVAPDFEHLAAAIAYSAFAESLRLCALLIEWRAAVLGATADADRFLRAAKAQRKLWLAEPVRPPPEALVARTGELETLDDIAGVGPLLLRVAEMPLPVGVLKGKYRSRIPANASSDGAQDGDATPAKTELSVAFVKFTLDGALAADIHYLSPGQTHDIEIEVTVSRWPDGAETLELRPLSIEPVDTHDFPTFRLFKTPGDPPYRISQRGRGILKVSQGFHARPFEFKYSAHFMPVSAEQPVAVVGRRILRIDAVDLKQNSLTGYPRIDAKIVQLRDEIRSRPAMVQQELSDALAALVPIANFAGRCVQDNLVREPWSEARLQAEIRGELRRDPAVGAELEEHPRSAGGITDLSFRGIRIELKVESNKLLTLTDCDQFLAQTTGYIVGTGKQIGILCVLDGSSKTGAPFPVEEGLTVRMHGADGASICIIVVLVQGNLARPSDLSR